MDVHKAIKNRRSVRDFDTRPIPDNSYQRLLDALRYAPSACNLQPWHFVLVHDLQLRRQLAAAAYRQMWMADAPLTVVACGYPQNAYKSMGGHFNSIEVDLSIPLDHLTLAAVAEDLATCWIGAFDEQAVKDLLHVPPQARVIALMPVGCPCNPDLNHPLADSDRKKPDEIFSTDNYT